MDQIELDKLLLKYKAQPVGDGYIDIIVSRENYNDFILELYQNNFNITDISWWEWCFENEISKYGMGGVRSNFYDGWFSELSIDTDKIKEMNRELGLIFINSCIENKTIIFQNKIITFKNHQWLIPAIWLDVPKDWINEYYR